MNDPLLRIIQSSFWPSMTLAELRVLVCLVVSSDEKQVVYEDSIPLAIRNSTMQATAFRNNLRYLIERHIVRKGYSDDRLMDFWEVML